MKNVKIFVKTIFSFMLVAVLSGIMGIYLISHLDKVEERDIMLYEHGAVPLSLLVKTAEQAILMQVYAREIRLVNTIEERNGTLKAIEECRNVLEDVINQQISLAFKDDVKTLLRSALNPLDTYVAEMRSFTASLNLNQDGANAHWGNAAKAADEVMRIGNLIIGQKVQETGEISTKNIYEAENSKKIAAIILVIIILISIFLAWHLTISTIRPLEIIVKNMESSDLTKVINVDRGDELGKLGKAYNDLSAKFRNILKDVWVDWTPWQIRRKSFQK